VSDYTPTTEEVRHGYVGKQAVCVNHGDWITKDQWTEFGAEFDRWLAERDRQKQAQAWDEGYVCGYRDGYGDDLDTPNPYRQGENK